MKKYEVFVDKEKTGIISINETAIKKLIAVSLSGVLSVISLNGCSFLKKTENDIHTNATFIVDDVNNDLSDEEIFSKQYFVDSVLENLYETENENLTRILFVEYEYLKNLEEQVDPTNEYYVFLTDEEINEKKKYIIGYLNTMINIIESNTNYVYGTDFTITKSK